MKKSYSHYNSDDLKTLGITVSRCPALFEIEPIAPSEFLLTLLEINQQLPIESEKAKSELLITPILNEVRIRNRQKFTYFSGYQFNVDASKGLKGFCDFIICKKFDAVFIESPLIAMVEAKHNQDLFDAAPQCIAEMVAAQIFNDRNAQTVPFIYGVITNGYEWLFLKLEQQHVTMDTQRYTLQNLPQLLGAWQSMIEQFD
jgi:type I site-specific restriction endonuclease